MKQIQLTKNKVALVDDIDYDSLIEIASWYASSDHNNGTYYVRGQHRTLKKEVSIHNIILNPPKGYIVDHIDGDPLNNQRSNLRLATISQNNRNVRKRKTPSSSGYKGVSKTKKQTKWYASIKFNKKSYNLGLYDLEEDAAKAYDKKALEFFGEFANINFKKG